MASYHAQDVSPYSSTGHVESAGGTPDTRLTAFSPEDNRLTKHASIYKSAGTPLKEGQHDPFVTTSAQPKAEQKLSATASSFRPLVVRDAPPIGTAGVNGSSAIPGTAQYLNQIIAESTPPPRAPEPIEALKFGTFTTDTGASRSIKISGIYGKLVMPAVQASLEALSKTFSLLGSSIRVNPVGNVVYMRMGNIVDASVIYNTVKKDHLDLAVEYISPGDFGQIVSPGSKHSAHEGQVLLCATYPTVGDANRKDFEESLRALLAVEGPLCAWKRISAPGATTFQLVAEYADAAMAPRAVSRCAEQQNSALSALMATVSLYTPDASPKRLQTPVATPTRASADPSSLSDTLSRLSIHTPQCPPYLATMAGNAAYDITGAVDPLVMGGGLYSPNTMASLGQQQYLTTLHQRPFAVNPFGPFNNLPVGYSPPGPQHGFDRNYGPFQNQQYHHNLYYNSPYNDPSTRGGRYLSGLSPGREVTRRGLSAPHHRRASQNPAAGQHNHVDCNRIQAGSDVRTTVMLRNIPNKVDQLELKEILDQSSFGRYDFMYLRIDFSNDCNVGYAFINFADPLDIVPFVRARANQKWHKFKSDKIAEVSYATIQGRDCLIQKFRNSSVMLEPPHYRPKLFFTHNDPRGRAGDEDEFPASDNASKLKRSCENAEHVGLFAPNAGQHLRDEQRRRRSQYDRGTSLAEREDSVFDEDQSGYYSGYSQRYHL